MPSTRYDPNGDPDDGSHTPPYGFEMPADYAPTYATPPEPPRRRGRWGMAVLAVVVAALLVAAFFAVREAVTEVPTPTFEGSQAQPVGSPAAEPSPAGDPPTAVPVEPTPQDGGLGPGVYRVPGQARPGTWTTAGATDPELPCYAEVFAAAEDPDVIGESLGRRDGREEITITIPRGAAFFATTGCQDWRRR